MLYQDMSRASTSQKATHSGKKYIPWLHMQIHQIKSNAALQVSVDSTERDFIANVCDPQIAKVGFRDSLVDCFVFSDTAEEISFSLFARKVLIVWVAGGDFEGDVGSNDCGIVAYGLQEDDGHALFFGDTGGDFCTKRGGISYYYYTTDLNSRYTVWYGYCWWHLRECEWNS